MEVLSLFNQVEYDVHIYVNTLAVQIATLGYVYLYEHSSQ